MSEKEILAVKEREQRIYNERKERFTAKINNNIAVIKRAIKVYNFAIEALKSFDGKVLNTRYSNAIHEKIRKYFFSDGYHGYTVWCELSTEYAPEYSGNVGKLKIGSNEGGESVCFVLIIILKPSKGKYVNERIDYQATLDLDCNSEKILQNVLKEVKDSIKKYDSVLKKAQKIKEAIEDYRKLDFNVRVFLHKDGFFNNSFYL